MEDILRDILHKFYSIHPLKEINSGDKRMNSSKDSDKDFNRCLFKDYKSITYTIFASFNIDYSHDSC